MSIVLGGNDGDNDNDLSWPDNCKLTFFNVKTSTVYLENFIHAFILSKSV